MIGLYFLAHLLFCLKAGGVSTLNASKEPLKKYMIYDINFCNGSIDIDKQTDADYYR